MGGSHAHPTLRVVRACHTSRNMQPLFVEVFR
jgi:hypothetical protein